MFQRIKFALDRLKRMAGDFIVIVQLLFVSAGMSQARLDSSQVESAVRTLELGKPIERELKGGEVHTYQIMPTAGQYLHVVVDQRGIDVIVALFGPDGNQLIEVDNPNGLQGPEPLSWITEVAGTYRVSIRSLKKELVSGRYMATIEALRVPGREDKERCTAAITFSDGKKLKAHGKADSLRLSLAKFEQALPLWRKIRDRFGEASTLYEIGAVCNALDEQKRALEFFNQALALFRVLENRAGEAITLNDMAEAYDNLGDVQKGVDYYGQALTIYRALNDREGIALALNNLGVVYRKIGENQKALACYQQVLPVVQATGNRLHEGMTLNNIGFVYNILGEPQKTLDYYFQALPILREVKNRREEAVTLNNIGLVYQDMGEYQKALEYFSQALPLRREVGNRRGEAATLNNTGMVYHRLGDLQRALEYYQQALTLTRAVIFPYGEAITLNNIGVVYDAMGEYQKALEYYQQSLPIRRTVQDRYGEAYTLNNIGDVYNQLGEYLKATEYFNQALVLYRTTGNRREEASALQDLGAVYAALSEKEKALEYYVQALTLRQEVEDRRGEAETRYHIARVEGKRGNLGTALDQIKTALTISDSLRVKVVNRDLRTSYFASMQDYYEYYIDLLMQKQFQPDKTYSANALEASERARARSLLETLTEAHIDIRQGGDSLLLARERLLQQQLNAKEQYHIKLLSGKHTPEQVEAAEKEIASFLTQYQEVQAQIRATSPSYAALTQPQPLNLSEIQQQVLDDHTILLEYALGDERSFLWLVTSNALASFELAKREIIEAAARRVYQLLTARNLPRPANETAKQKQERLARLAKVDAEYFMAADSLSQMLLGSVAAQLGTKRLLVVADGALQYIPFGALPIPQLSVNSGQSSERRPKTPITDDWSLKIDYRPLIINHEILSLPSASVLAVLRRESAGRKPSTKIVAVLADPVFSRDDLRVKNNLRNGQKDSSAPTKAAESQSLQEMEMERAFRSAGIVAEGVTMPRLGFSRQEAEAIFAFAPSQKSMKALDFAASRATATSAELRQYRIVHFATHGLLNSVHPELSGVVLSLVDENGAPQNGFLRLHEIYNLNLPADLVVLSACQTALGKEVKGEGLIGLTRGFMYAGAPRVVASLWKVDDEATAELMKRFYQKMLGKEKLRPAAALQAAQVEMSNEQYWRSPYYWAAFVLQGEWR